MGNVNEKTFQRHSMPVHNPLYRIGPVCFRANIAKAELAVEKPEVIAGIVPQPLIYDGNKIIIVLMEVTELKEGFSEEDALWNEMGIQIGVTYKGDPWIYVCEIYSGNIRNILSGRELFGYPKVPGRISIVRSAQGATAKLLTDGSNREILNFVYKLLPVTPSPAGPIPRIFGGKTAPKTILFKYIPSAILGNRPEVQQLVAIQYGKPVIHHFMQAEGNIEILEGAPAYLKEAGITKPVSISYTDMEMNVIGGEILHNYNL